jgi:predicted kinase
MNFHPMSLKLILTKGLPASGKTTWAKDYLQKHPNTVNLCTDDLRLQLATTQKREKFVLKTRDRLTEHYLENGYSVIWSDTNLNPIHANRAQVLADQYQAKLIIQDFTQVPLAECIQRDLRRANSVGQQVITKMYYDYLAQTASPPAFNPALPSCYLVDVDGTLAIHTQRKPFDWDRVGEDLLYESVATLVRQLAKNYEIVVLSGRSQVCRPQTEQWLVMHEIPYCSLHMRPEDDCRSDEILKAELYRQDVCNRFNVMGVIDDRPKVCRMWRSLGLTVFQVGNPDYEF